MNIDQNTHDIIKETLNIGIGEAANALSMLVNTRVTIQAPDILIMSLGEIREYIQREVEDFGVYISQQFSGEIKGKSLLFYTKSCSIDLLNLVSGGFMKTSSLSEASIATLNEIGNIIMASCLSGIIDLLKGKLHFDIPETTVSLSDVYFGDILEGHDNKDLAIIIKNEMMIHQKNVRGFLFILLAFDDFQLVIEVLKDSK